MTASPSIPALIRIAMLVLLIAHGWCPAYSAPATEQELTAFEKTRKNREPVDLKQAAAELPEGSPVRFLLVGRATYLEGAWAMSIRHMQGALRTCQAVETQLPEGSSVHWRSLAMYRLAQSLMAGGRVSEQLAVLREYRELDYGQFEQSNGLNTPGWFFEALALVKAGKTTEASQLVEAVKIQAEAAPSEPPLQAMLREIELLLSRLQGDDPAVLLERYSAMIREKESQSARIPVSWHGSVARLSLQNGDYAAARSALLRSTETPDPSSANHPFRQLTRLDHASGKWREADQQVERCWQWQMTRRTHVREELGRETLATVACGYLGRGLPRDAWRVIEPLLRQQSRSGFRFRQPEQWEAGLCLAAVAALRIGPEDRMARLASGFTRKQLESRFRARITKLLSGSGTTLNCFQLTECPVWLWGETIRVLGPARARDLLTQRPPQGETASALIAAVSCEIELARGREQQALDLSGQALEELPIDELLLRTRARAIRAEALRRLNRNGEAAAEFAAVMRDCPAMIALTGYRLPVFTSEKINDRRLRRDAAGLRMQVKSSSEFVELTLFGPTNSVLRTASAEAEAGTEGNLKRRALDRLFHAGPALGFKEFDHLEGRLIKDLTSDEKDRVDQMLDRFSK